MSQYNAQKNPPWARTNEFGGQPSGVQQMMNPNVLQYPQQSIGNPQQSQVYQAQIAMQQQALSMQQFVNTAQSMYNPAVSGLAAGSRPMNMMGSNPVMVPQAAVMQQQQPSNQRDAAANSAPKQQRVFTGTVTKVVDTYGFVDEDVFFQMSCVKGPHPVLHDRVLVEAVCLPTMPFKWNATRVQVLPMNEQGGGGGGGGNSRKRPLSPRRDDRSSYSAVPPPNDFDNRRGPERDRDRERERIRATSRGKSPDVEERRRRRERREREEKERERDKESRVKSRSRSRSPKRSRAVSPVKKYRVRLPEVPLDVYKFTVSLIKSRYSSMYIPSDFFSAACHSPDQTPQQRPLQLAGAVRFHIVDKDIEPVFPRDDLLEPADADFLYSAKVMLLSIPTKEELIRRCVQLAEEKEAGRRVHAARLVDCLVGVNTRSKSEYLALGGPWSPSLDGEDPVNDPNVLIKTAMRCCRALTGVDLTNVTKWYRFSELHYHRGKTTYKGKEVPARVETVVIYTPDVWSVMPSALEWDGIHLNYQRALNKRLAEMGPEAAAAAQPEDEKETETVEVKEPTHWSKIDIKTIKVVELREELVARAMSPKGLRLQLIARLNKQLKQEQDQEELEAKDRKDEVKDEKRKDKDKPKEEEKKAKENDDKDKDKSRQLSTERYKLPETPHVIVHPCKKAKGGKLNCKVVCLSLLLDYTQDNNKEHTFEVSLFAENLNEMIMRDFGHQIYEALSVVPEKEEIKDDSKENAKDNNGKPKDEKAKEKTENEKDKSKETPKDKKDKAKEKPNDDKSKEENEKLNEDNVANEVKMETGENDVTKEVKVEDSSEDKEKKSENGDKNGDKEKAVNGKDDDEEKRRRRRDRDKERDKDRKKKEKVPHVTINKNLLLAFSYFDTTLYGKIAPNDLEELMQMLGLLLSRSQIKKLVSKIPSSEPYFDYRKLTDTPVKPESTGEGEAVVEKTVIEPTLAEIIASFGSPITAELGNTCLIPQFSLSPPERKQVVTPPSKRTRRSEKVDIKTELSSSEGCVLYNGAYLNVHNLELQLNNNESARLKAEEKSLGLKHELDAAKEKLNEIQKQLKEVKKELGTSQKKLEGTNEKLNRELISSETYLTTLMDIQERIMPILDTDEINRLIRLRQELLGAPSINLVPLTKLIDIPLQEDVEMEDVTATVTAKVEDVKKEKE